MARGVKGVEIPQTIGQQPSEQKFQRKIIDPLMSLQISQPRRIHPVIDDTITRRKRGRHKPVARPCGSEILADRI